MQGKSVLIHIIQSDTASSLTKGAESQFHYTCTLHLHIALLPYGTEFTMVILVDDDSIHALENDATQEGFA